MEQHYLFSGNETSEEIRQILVDNCEGTEDMTYSRQLTEDELNIARETYVSNNLDIASCDDELKAAKAYHKAKIKPLKEEAADLLKTLKSRYQEVKEKVYKLPDHKAGMMEYVNLEGVVVHSRRLKPEERQGRMFPVGKVAGE